jgi:uncharacterized protein YjiS (DUF1127 family)
VRPERIVTLWHLWRQRARDRRLAAQFSDRDLWDVGLTRGDVYRELAGPFWWTQSTSTASVRTEATGATSCSRPLKVAATAAE